MEPGKSLQGHLLVASAVLVDLNFRKTVVLMIHHDDDGALGLVLNRPSDMKVDELWDKIAETPCQSEQVLHVGGPVEGPLMALHTHEDLSEIEVLPGVYFCVQKQNLNELVARPDDSFRLFVGHAGWGGGQLAGELAEGLWLTTPAKPPHIFEPGDDIWESVFREITRASGMLQVLKVKHVPPDPSMN